MFFQISACLAGKREYKALKRLVHAMHIMPIHHVRRVYDVVKRSMLLGIGILCLFSVFGVTFYMLYSFVLFLQTPSAWSDNKLMSTVNTVQISQQKPVLQASSALATPAQLSKRSIKRLDNIIALAYSGKSTLSGIPIIGSPVGFALGAWIAYNNPDQGWVPLNSSSRPRQGYQRYDTLERKPPIRVIPSQVFHYLSLKMWDWWTLHFRLPATYTKPVCLIF